MTGSATESTGREARKRVTARRIRDCALVLSDERGFDGWTMDELAEACGVSRRTLFNYFPGKVDAVLGTGPEPREDVLAVFHQGGPHGRLIDDLLALAEAALAQESFEADTVALRRRVLGTTPRLLAVAHERFELLMQDLVDHILRREGRDFGLDRARLLARLFVTVFDASLHQLLEQPDGPPIAELFAANVRQARDLLA